jgi:hypothetical protein
VLAPDVRGFQRAEVTAIYERFECSINTVLARRCARGDVVKADAVMIEGVVMQPFQLVEWLWRMHSASARFDESNVARFERPDSR